MVTLTAVGEPERPKTTWERQQEAKKALQAAREAVDAAERRLDTYQQALASSDRVYKGYQRQQYEQTASRNRTMALDELTEAVKHLSDVVRIWWPHLTVSYWVTNGLDGPGAA